MIGIVGLGNVLMGDDGVGIEVINELKENYIFNPDVTLIDGGVGSFSLPFHIFKKVIIIDAVRDEDKNPGDILLFTKEDILSGGVVQKLSMHDISLDEVFFLLAIRSELPDEIILLGIVPLRVENMEIGLSSAVRKKIPDLIDKIKSILDEWGIVMERRDRRSVSVCQ